ncbi:hypothetical protein L4P86_001704 [Pseudomonas aeruginosa]|nr:hypothetical protein [Pseudomonas aeruginosa]
MQQNENFAKQAEQAEAETERPEVVEAYAKIGRAVEDSISRNLPDWFPSDCPSEVIVHLINERDAALARVAELEGKLTDWVHEGFRLNEALAVAKAQHSGPDHAELLQALERTHAGHMVGHDQSDQPKGGYSDGYVNGFGECIKVARKVLATSPAQARHSVPEEFIGRLSEFLAQRGTTGKALLRELRDMLAAAPGCHLSRNALTEAQMRRLYENSTETENERLGFEAFARLIRRAEAVHQITAAPGKEVGHE